MHLPRSIRPVHVLALTLLSTAAACSSGLPTMCAMQMVPTVAPALQVSVVDSLTGSAPAVPSTLTVRSDTSFQVTSDSTAPPGSPQELVVMYLAPGTYELTVQASGYHDWTRIGLLLRTGKCGQVPVQLTARLVSDSL